MNAQIALGHEPEALELWVLDPAVGAGVMLLAALAVYRENHGLQKSTALTLLGVDIDPRVCEIARASLLLAGASPTQFWIGDGNAPAQPLVGRERRTGELRALTPHVVIANPPFGTKVSMAALEADAQRGPLIVPDEVLYRAIPKVLTDRRPLPEPTARDDASETPVPWPAQLELPWAA
jgi:type I restriction-modification system DNA methylase subunit